MKDGNDENYLVHLIREVVAEMESKEIVVQWIPLYLEIEGNEKTDELAAEGNRLLEVGGLMITTSDAKQEIKRSVLALWQ